MPEESGRFSLAETAACVHSLEELAQAETEETADAIATRLRTLLGSDLAGYETLVERLVRRARELDEARRLSETDPLTGISNRRPFLAAVERELARWRRGGRSFAVLLLDLDDLKRINDSLGHAAGDEAIMTVARLASAQMRKSDLVARIGGDEFAVLLANTGELEARATAERLQSAVRRAGIRGAWLSVSIGIASSERLVEPAGAELLLELADRSLYRSKRAA